MLLVGLAIGSGPLDQFLSSFIASNRLGECVKMIGHVERAEALARVQASDFLVLPSLYEASPTVLLEVVRLGKPALVYDLPWGKSSLSVFQV